MATVGVKELINKSGFTRAGYDDGLGLLLSRDSLRIASVTQSYSSSTVLDTTCKIDV